MGYREIFEGIGVRIRREGKEASVMFANNCCFQGADQVSTTRVEKDTILMLFALSTTTCLKSAFSDGYLRALYKNVISYDNKQLYTIYLFRALLPKLRLLTTDYL